MIRFVDHLYTFSRWGIGGLFIYAGSIKLIEPGVFAVLIDAFGIVPERLLWPMAVVLPVLEVTAGIALLFDIEGSLAVIAGLLALFIVIMGYAIRMGLDIDCGCFGPQDPETRAFHGLRTTFNRDLVMLIGVSGLYGWRRGRGIQPVRLAPIFLSGFSKMSFGSASALGANSKPRKHRRIPRRSTHTEGLAGREGLLRGKNRGRLDLDPTRFD